MKKYAVFALIILSQLFACKKNSPNQAGGGTGPDTTGTTPGNTTGDFKDIYVVGFMNYDPSVLNQTSATLWKNGKATRLSTLPSAAYAVAVDAGDVFVVGSTPVTGTNNTYATYWLNGVEHHLTEGLSYASATSVDIQYFKTGPGDHDVKRSVTFAGTDQYLPGGGVELWRAVSWDEDGTKHNFAQPPSQCTGHFLWVNNINGNPIACGNMGGQSPSSTFAAIWPDPHLSYPGFGQPKVGLSPGSTVNGMALALYLQPDTAYKIFACGKDKIPGETNFRATFWNEGTPTYLTDGSNYATAKDISVTMNNKAYICGEEQFTQGKYTAVYWKPDGTVVKLSGSTNNAFATNIIAWKNTVLVCGHEAAPTGAGLPQIFTAKYWNNGVAVNLSDGIHNATAYGMAVK